MVQTELIKGVSKNVAHLLNTTGKELLIHGYKTYFVDSEQLNLYDSLVGGYLEPISRSLAIAIRRPEEFWVPIYTHEYGHFLQVFYYPWITDKARMSLSILNDHKKKIKLYHDRYIKTHINHVLACEIDAEKTGIGLMKSFDVFEHIGNSRELLERNIKKTNAYLFSIVTSVLHQCKFDKIAAKEENVWEKMPITFDIDYYIEHPNYFRLFFNYCKPVFY